MRVNFFGFIISPCFPPHSISFSVFAMFVFVGIYQSFVSVVLFCWSMHSLPFINFVCLYVFCCMRSECVQKSRQEGDASKLEAFLHLPIRPSNVQQSPIDDSGTSRPPSKNALAHGALWVPPSRPPRWASKFGPEFGCSPPPPRPESMDLQ